MSPEIPLLGGDVTVGVVRVGDTVRRPRGAHSDSVVAYLSHLAAVRFDGAPRWHGVDQRGRDILDYVDGDVPQTAWDRWAIGDSVLAELSRLLRCLHDASASFVAPADARWFGEDVVLRLPDEARVEGGGELITHSDVTPQNTVFRNGRPVALVDFDMTGPTTRLVDLINTAVHWLPLRHPLDRPEGCPDERVLHRLALLVNEYCLDQADRDRFVDTAQRMAARSWYRMRANAEQLGGGWARMWSEGVGDQILRRRAWLQEHGALVGDAVVGSGAGGSG